MLLDDRTAVIYGGGGAIGGAVARAFAREGATVHLAGRTPATLDAVAEEIRAAGAAAETARVDALDEGAVDEHADAVRPRGRGHRHLVQRDLAQLRARDPDGGDGARRLRGRDRDDGQDHLPHREGGRPAHDPARLGGDPRLRRLGRSAARLLHRRHPGRLRGHRADAAPALGRARAPRHPRRDPSDRRRARVAPEGFEGREKIVESIVSRRPCSAAPRRSRTSATSRPSSPPTGRARSPRPRSTSAAGP